MKNKVRHGICFDNFSTTLRGIYIVHKFWQSTVKRENNASMKFSKWELFWGQKLSHVFLFVS